MINLEWEDFCKKHGIEMSEDINGKKEVESKLIYDIDFNYITGMA